YPEYKESGAEWLGKIPQHWNCVRLKYCADLKGDKVEMGSMQRYVGMENIESGNGKYIAKTDILPEGLSTSFSKDDVLFGKLRPYLAKSWLADFSGICSSEFLVLRSLKVCPQFLNYYTLSDEFINQVDASTYGSKMPRASWDFIGLMAVPVPANESEKIANFLDHETAKIDTLIEKQQQLIKLLKEKRQAVISHAVTKGLNPNAKMRDSGVEWLGEVPQHWEVSRIKNVVSEIVDGPHFSPKYQDEGYMFISARNIKVDRWSLEDAKYISEADFHEFNKRVRPGKGDVLLTKGGTTGVARAVDLDFPFQVWVHVAVLKTNQTLMDPFYLAYVLNGTACYEQSQQYTFGATNNDLGLSRIAKIIFARPSIAEQRQLRVWLDDECKKFDCLISKGLESIQLMQERRTALISAAVTGKIDIRNWQAPNG
ncbi:MAG: restriction endonuclease subunit S, partial [Nitrosomonas sp.]|nr:restriction endonuclease subunit S [Nitrosomonas sp.]